MTTPRAIRLSVIMPAYNEEAGIREAVRGVQTHILDHVADSELVVVNDGSRDATGSILDTLAATEPRLRVVHKKNAGHGPAIRTGLDAATGEFVFLLDSDDQIPPEAFSGLWAEVERGRQAVFGVRRVRRDAKLRVALTAVVRAGLWVLFGVRLYDANVPFKILRRDLWVMARPHIPEDTLAPSLFLAVFLARRRCDLAFVDVSHRDRHTGEVSIRRWKLARFCARAFRQLLAFRLSVRA